MNSLKNFDRVILLTHPAHMPFNSIHKFCDILQARLRQEGVVTSVTTSRSHFSFSRSTGLVVKVLRYLDQYIAFPIRLLRSASSMDERVLYVFIDQGLGFWIPFVSRQRHCIFVHDFAALRKSRGHFVGQKSSFKERVNQRLIAAGVKFGKYFICISENSKRDLLQLVSPPNIKMLSVIPNALNEIYYPISKLISRKSIGIRHADDEKVLIYVGTCAFNKNVLGLLSVFKEINICLNGKVRLLMVSEISDEVRGVIDKIGVGSYINVYKNVDKLTLNKLYSAADFLIMPSIYEGFGWPLIEAQACGTPVITTDRSPMRDVAGPHSNFIPSLDSMHSLSAWVMDAVSSIVDLMELKRDDYELLCKNSIVWARQFDQKVIYKRYLECFDCISEA